MEKNEKLIIIFVLIALFLIIVSIILIHSPLDEKESCLTAGYSWNDEKEICIKWGKPIYCSTISSDMCNMIYQPVCGWFDPNKIRCAAYPCAKTFSNDCFACSNKNVLYYTQGVCPS